MKVEQNGKVEETLLEGKEETVLKIKAYKARWIILGIFMTYSCVNSFQWIEYSSITQIIVKYYKVSPMTVDWTSIVYNVLYPIFVIPASYIIDKEGLRIAGLIGCIGTAIGTGVKVFSIRNDLFFVVLIGQAIVSASQIVILCLPPKIASVWFKPNEVSTACSLGVFGTMMGTAIGYILPPILVKDSDNVDEIGSGLNLMCWMLTITMIPATIAVIFFFPKQPKLPPSLAQAALRESKGIVTSKTFFVSIKKLFTNKGFLIHMTAYGINIAVFSAVGTLLSQFILQYFVGANEEAGRMGFVMVVTGTVGSVIFGIILDKTHKYKETTLGIYAFSAVSVVALMYSLELRSVWLTYLTCAFLGLFTNAYMPVGFELAMELTFPSEESTTAGILMAMTQILGAIFTVGLGYLNLWFGCYWSLASQAGFLFIGTLVTWGIPNKLLRQEAFKEPNNDFQRKASHHGSRLVFIE